MLDVVQIKLIEFFLKIMDMNIPFELISHVDDENDEYGENISVIN